ncbi:MAG: TRAP transporter TatT component family protein [Acidiferrobacterales bacterium]
MLFRNHLRTLSIIVVLLTVFTMTGCASIVSSATGRFANSLSAGILNQDDPQTVADGAPAYLILIDGLIDSSPKDVSLLLAGAKLYDAYGSVFVENRQRILKMSDKAFSYGARAQCLSVAATCGMEKLPYDEFVLRLAKVKQKQVPVLYVYATTWAGWIQPRSQDWNAVADLAKVKAALKRVIELEETYDRGGAHLYMGVLSTLIPPALGGNPKEAQAYFERAITLSEGKNLMVKVYYAQRYARMMFDRKLHDRLLNQVLKADVYQKGFVLSNTIAQREARKLLNSAEEYF